VSPEELEATREGANVDYAPDIAYEDWQAMARALLAHIDSQAVTINNLAAALDEAKVDQVNFSSACQEELDTQAAQIEALKEKLVEERAANIWAMWELMHYNSDECAVPSEFIDTLENFNGCTECELESCAAKSWFVADARQQLKADPDLQKSGVTWDE